MREIRWCIMAVEAAMLLGVIIASFCTDWEYLQETGDAWTMHLLIVLMSICATVLQKEQQTLKDDEEME